MLDVLHPGHGWECEDVCCGVDVVCDSVLAGCR